MSPLDSRTAFEGTNGSERLLRAIVDVIPTPTWFGRTAGTAEFMNQRWLDYTGFFGAVLRWCGSHTDIDHRKRAGAAAQGQEDRELVMEGSRRTPCAGEAAPQ